MTDPVALRPTPSGILRFALTFGSLVAIPAALGWTLSGGAVVIGLAVAAGAYVVVGVLLWILAVTDRHYVRVDPNGIAVRGVFRTQVVPWVDVAAVDLGGPGASRVWIKRRAVQGKEPDPIVLAPFLFGLDATRLRQLLRPPASVE
jgi:hypothetical protein